MPWILPIIELGRDKLLVVMVILVKIQCPGMDNQTVLDSLQRGYRMPKPIGDHIQCPDELYNVMAICWTHDPMQRPTFEYLYSTFEDFFVATEVSYRQPTN